MNTEKSLSRRQFFKVSSTVAAGLATAATLAGCNAESNTKGLSTTSPAKRKNKVLDEHGFWDYTAPATAGMELFQKDDYLLLFDDMAEAGMNSMVICPKWMTTGYRSRLPYLDQTEDNPVTASDNELLRFAIAEAAKRKISVRLLAVLNFFPSERFDSTKGGGMKEFMGYPFPEPIRIYDSDNPLVVERAAEICAELVEQFPGIVGIIGEVEEDNIENPRRIPLYNKWAKQNNKPSFEEIGRPRNPRRIANEWREYTSIKRTELMKTIEKATRAKGFEGDYTILCAIGGGGGTAISEMDYPATHKQLPNWHVVAYEYGNASLRYAKKDVAISVPKSAGIRTYNLPRGLLTYELGWMGKYTLQQHWQRDVEDFQLFRPDGVWWFGCGTLNDGAHVSLTKLRELGFRDGVHARRELIKAASVL